MRFGSAFHLGLELRGELGENAAIDKAVESYAVIPAWADPVDWSVERETLRALLAGYFWHYQNDNIEVLVTEGAWEAPLVNPVTAGMSRTYSLAGKIDKIVTLDDGRLAVMEHKTTGEDISDASEYWQRLRCDAQISAYVYAARVRGHNVQTVLYDVTRKPEIAPKLIPIVDENGFKVVVNTAGDRVYNKNGKPRESASKEDGWTLKTTRETAESFGARLLSDIGERPDFYFARREIPRLEEDLIDFQHEVWQQGQQLLQAERAGRWFKNVSMMTCRNCTYKEICLQGVNVDPANPPSGFVILPDAHPELSGETV